jgi:hypothetical protein
MAEDRSQSASWTTPVEARRSKLGEVGGQGDRPTQAILS